MLPTFSGVEKTLSRALWPVVDAIRMVGGPAAVVAMDAAVFGSWLVVCFCFALAILVRCETHATTPSGMDYDPVGNAAMRQC